MRSRLPVDKIINISRFSLGKVGKGRCVPAVVSGRRRCCLCVEAEAT